MDAKRRIFPRFYFVSDRDMLSCLSASDVDGLVRLLPSMYTSLRQLENTRGEVTAFIAKDGVTIKNDQPLPFGNEPVETWMAKMDRALQVSMRKALQSCLAEFAKTQLRQWIFKWNAQLVDLVCKISLTQELVEVVSVTGVAGLRSYLRKVLRLLEEQFRMSTIAELTSGERTVLSNMLAHQLHTRETVGALIERDVATVDQLMAFPILHASLKPSGDLVISLCQTTHSYGFELRGNYATPVIHTFNYSASRSLLISLAAGSASLLLGGVATGKTELVSEISTLLGRYLCILTCSRAFQDVDLLSSMKGCAAIGAILCFENVQLFSEPTMAALKTAISALYQARRANERVFTYRGTEIALNHDFACLATATASSPAELPDTVLLAFRP
ncbi:MAG: hypothetical protein Q8J97_09685, partial [Flavobacteriaceae bacterium]|nr:hypothetical protein [Flavobacteriaceae bacterium]